MARPYGVSSLHHADQVSCIRSITTKPKKWSILAEKGEHHVYRSVKGEQLSNKEVPLPEQQQIDPRFRGEGDQSPPTFKGRYSYRATDRTSVSNNCRQWLPA